MSRYDIVQLVTDDENSAEKVDEDDENEDIKCRQKFYVPRSKANFTDAHGTPHPTWAKPFFAKEFKNFDEVFKRPNNG